MSPIEIVIRLVRAEGPVSRDQIERELLTHCTTTPDLETATRQAEAAIQHGLAAGWLVRFYYDSEEAYDLGAHVCEV